MPKIRIRKAEIELCFERFLIDAEDDFFPDPLRYKDLRQVRAQIVSEIQKTLTRIMNENKIKYTVKLHYPWDVPKENYVIREGCSFHPYDIIVFHFVLNRLVPIIEPKLSKARYSYRMKKTASQKLFGYNPTENWINFKNDIRKYFSDNPDYEYLVSTDVAGFFENIPIQSFKKQLLQMCNKNERQAIELLCFMLKEYSVSNYSGMPQNCDPFSYLCTAFLDFLDKELEAKSLKHFRYVDDIKVACRTKTDAKKAIIQIIQTLRTAHLNLSTAKTDIIPVNSEKFNNMLKEFPAFLHDIDNAVHNKQKRTINNLYPKLVSYTREVMKQKKDNFDERLFRACIWRIVKINYFKNINKLDLDSIGKKCLKLLDSMPSRTNTFLRFLVLHKNRAYVQDALYALLQDTVYPWQEMLIWYLLIQCDRIKNINILNLAKHRARDPGYDEAARNYIYIFLGKHGDYQDRRHIANLFPLAQSFRAQRSILIAIQEYQDRNTIYNSITSANSDLILVSLVRYIKQLATPEYVDVDKNIASDIAFS
jgi:hypothetical protein